MFVLVTGSYQGNDTCGDWPVVKEENSRGAGVERKNTRKRTRRKEEEKKKKNVEETGEKERTSEWEELWSNAGADSLVNVYVNRRKV